MEAARPSPFLQPTIERLREIATRDIVARNIGTRPGENQLTVVLAGYIDSDAPPLGCLCCISNFEDVDGRRYPVRPAFESYLITQDRPNPEPFHLMNAYGSTDALKNRASQEDGAVVGRLLEQRRPARAIRDKALEALNRVAARAAGNARLLTGTAGNPVDASRSTSSVHPDQLPRQPRSQRISAAMCAHDHHPWRAR